MLAICKWSVAHMKLTHYSKIFRHWLCLLIFSFSFDLSIIVELQLRADTWRYLKWLSEKNAFPFFWISPSLFSLNRLTRWIKLIDLMKLLIYINTYTHNKTSKLCINTSTSIKCISSYIWKWCDVMRFGLIFVYLFFILVKYVLIFNNKKTLHQF